MDVHFILDTKIVAILQQIRGQVVTSGTVSNQDVRVSRHRLADHLRSQVWVGVVNLPDGVVVAGDVHANFLVSAETGVAQWADLARVKVEGTFVND